MATTTLPVLADQSEIPYINEQGLLPQQFEGAIGAYAIFDDTHQLVHTGYSRNVLLSLKQNLIRNPKACHVTKVATIERPSKRLLEDIINAWHEELGGSPYHADNLESTWTESIQLLPHMTAEDRQTYDDPQLEHRAKVKLLKQTSRRIEADILAVLDAKGCKEDLRFNPKLKETGILDLK